MEWWWGRNPMLWFYIAVMFFVLLVFVETISVAIDAREQRHRLEADERAKREARRQFAEAQRALMATLHQEKTH